MNSTMIVSELTELTRARRSAIPFAVIGTTSIVTGGLVSAASASSPSYTASWSVAYLVLVVGMGQLALGLAQAWLAVKPPRAGLVVTEVITFNVASIAILLGTLTTRTVAVDAGAGLFLIALALFLGAVRGTRAHHKWALYAFRILIAALMVSTPIGLIIATVRAG